jgi:hypothetical protein
MRIAAAMKPLTCGRATRVEAGLGGAFAVSFLQAAALLSPLAQEHRLAARVCVACLLRPYPCGLEAPAAAAVAAGEVGERRALDAAALGDHPRHKLRKI